MKRNTYLSVGLISAVGIIALEAYALYLGRNGTMYALSISALAGIAGWHLKHWRNGKR